MQTSQVLITKEKKAEREGSIIFMVLSDKDSVSRYNFFSETLLINVFKVPFASCQPPNPII